MLRYSKTFFRVAQPSNPPVKLNHVPPYLQLLPLLLLLHMRLSIPRAVVVYSYYCHWVYIYTYFASSEHISTREVFFYLFSTTCCFSSSSSFSLLSQKSSQVSQSRNKLLAGTTGISFFFLFSFLQILLSLCLLQFLI